MKNSLLCTHIFHKTPNLIVSRCCFADDSKENVPKYITNVQSDYFCSLNLLFGGVLVSVAVLIASSGVKSIALLPQLWYFSTRHLSVAATIQAL